MPSIIGWIKNGRKGKNLAYMPASYPSERVPYGDGSVKDALDGLQFNQVAVSAGGKTFAQQMTELYTTWQNLSNEQKMRAFLKLDDVIYTLFSLNDGAFFMVSQDGSHVYNFYFNLRLGKFYLATNNSVSDSSSATNYSSMELYV